MFYSFDITVIDIITLLNHACHIYTYLICPERNKGWDSHYSSFFQGGSGLSDSLLVSCTKSLLLNSLYPYISYWNGTVSLVGSSKTFGTFPFILTQQPQPRLYNYPFCTDKETETKEEHDLLSHSDLALLLSFTLYILFCNKIK